MGLNLITGPANAGKVRLLLRRYLEALSLEPYLIVPNRSDVDRVERELLARRPALLGGTIGTFDDVFDRIAFDSPDARPVVSPTQRALLVRRVLSTAALNGLSISGQRAVAVGANGLIWRSADAGATWQQVMAPATSTLNAIGFASDDPQFGWAVGGGGALFVTEDGGAHFRAVASGLSDDLQSVEDL